MRESSTFSITAMPSAEKMRPNTSFWLSTSRALRHVHARRKVIRVALSRNPGGTTGRLSSRVHLLCSLVACVAAGSGGGTSSVESR